MKTRVTIAGHSVHAMLIAFPVAFYTATLVCYIVYAVNGNPFWFKVAVVANISGTISAAVAAIPGFIDWLFIAPDSSAKKTGFFHLIFNVIALICYTIAAFSSCKKWDEPDPSLGLAIPLTAVGFLLTMAAGFLGWALVQKHHIGVDDVPKN
ncbi:MAG TPA: DUF2231 domain-containing protein [Ferruginibacter sp.]|nr:DUF2231 domain-containing protein [Ferruginibacter sp.]